MSVGVVRRQRDRVAQGRSAVLEIAAVHQRCTKIGQRVGIEGLDFQRAVIGGDGVVIAPQRVQRVAEIAVSLGEVGLDGGRLTVGFDRLVVIPHFEKRDAEIAQRHRHLRLDRQRAPRRFRGETRPSGDAQHLAEIGVKQGYERRQLGRAPDMLDRLAELATLVCDEAEQMLGLGQIRLRFKNPPA
jgi:hypothetical protein